MTAIPTPTPAGDLTLPPPAGIDVAPKMPVADVSSDGLTVPPAHPATLTPMGDAACAAALTALTTYADALASASYADVVAQAARVTATTDAVDRLRDAAAAPGCPLTAADKASIGEAPWPASRTTSGRSTKPCRRPTSTSSARPCAARNSTTMPACAAPPSAA